MDVWLYGHYLAGTFSFDLNTAHAEGSLGFWVAVPKICTWRPKSDFKCTINFTCMGRPKKVFHHFIFRLLAQFCCTLVLLWFVKYKKAQVCATNVDKNECFDFF